MRGGWRGLVAAAAGLIGLLALAGLGSSQGSAPPAGQETDLAARLAAVEQQVSDQAAQIAALGQQLAGLSAAQTGAGAAVSAVVPPNGVQAGNGLFIVVDYDVRLRQSVSLERGIWWVCATALTPISDPPPVTEQRTTIHRHNDRPLVLVFEPGSSTTTDAVFTTGECHDVAVSGPVRTIDITSTLSSWAIIFQPK